jgi:RNA polymerase sigma factor (sigma-70 family)
VGDDEVDPTLAELCRDEHPRLVGLLVLYVGSLPVAEDLAQEALIRLSMHWPQVRAMPSPRNWLCSVGINLARSWWRRHYAERRANRRFDAGRATATTNETADAVAIWGAVASLPSRQRTALVLRYYAGFSVAEAADHLGCAQGTVKSLTNRAINGLRARLDIDLSDRQHGHVTDPEGAHHG